MYYSVMTDNERKTIREMRFRGYGYKLIARTLKMKRDKVRDYCRYHGLTGSKEDYMSVLQKEAEEGLVCKNCRLPLVRSSGRRSSFCSRRCRERYNKNQNEDNGKDVT